MHRLPRFLAVILAGGLLIAVTAGLLAPQVGTILTAHSTEPVDIDLDPLAQRSIVLDTNGENILAALHREENRKVIPLDDIPDAVLATVLAIEDENFFEHGGIDVRGITRALFTNVQAGDVRQGGSTITQQLVKNALLDSDQDFSRKIKEAVLAVRLENQLSKEEILERYLNTVYLGGGAYGIQAASEVYFGKQPGDLEPADAVLLTGLIKNPVGYDPFRFPEAAEGRRREVVRRLRSIGAIDEEAADEILATPLPTEPHAVNPRPDDYFVSEVIRLLLDDKRLGATPSDRYNALFRGGLTIRTTLDLGAQWTALAAVADTMPDSEGRFTSALVSVEPSSGAVRALVGGDGFERSKYNIATQGIGRQVGSSMKPFVLAAAIDSGISPRSTINGVGPCRFDNPQGEEPIYDVENFEGSRGSVASLYDQTRRSVNCAYVRLGQVVGLDKVVEMTERLGVTTPVVPNLSLPLGTSEIRPIDMASAYATLAAEGIYRKPYFIEEVRDRHDKVIYRHEDEPKRVLDAEVARQVIDVMKGTVTNGTGTAARFPDRRPAAGKTGTTADYGDAWFVGFTRQLSTAVWIGSPVGRVQMRGVLGVRRVTGGSYPARIWQAFMGPVHEGLPVEDWPEPEEIGPGTYLRAEGEAPRRRVVRRTTTTAAPPPEPEEPPTDDDGGNGNGKGNDNDGDGSGGDGSGGDGSGGDGSGGDGEGDGSGGDGEGNGNGNGGGEEPSGQGDGDPTQDTSTEPAPTDQTESGA